jgi:hypothetical protein
MLVTQVIDNDAHSIHSVRKEHSKRRPGSCMATLIPISGGTLPPYVANILTKRVTDRIMSREM